MSIQDEFEQIGQRHNGRNGATIGDGMRTTAKTAAWLGGATLLFQAAPMLLAAIAGCLFFLRSCSYSPSLTTRPSRQPSMPVAQPMPQISAPSQRSRRPRVTQPVVQPVIQPSSPPTVRQEARPVVVQPQQQVEQVYTDAPVRYDVMPQANPLQAAALEMASELQVMTPFGGVNVMPNLFRQQGAGLMGGGGQLPLMHSNHMSAEASFMRGALSDARGVAMLDSAGMFDFVTGGKFVGTSQMPGQPSKRCELVINAIRDRGTNISARMSLIGGGRGRRNFTGMIEDNPVCLTLIPELRRGETPYGWFTPWYGRSPRRITLNLEGDGKALYGKSQSGEQFEFVAKNNRVAAVAAGPNLRGLTNGEEIIWRLESKNAKAIGSEQMWQFKQTATRQGEFVWLNDDSTKATGEYQLDAKKKELLTLTLGAEAPKVYRCVFRNEGSSGDMRIWIPKDATKPAKADVKTDNVFALKFLQ